MGEDRPRPMPLPVEARPAARWLDVGRVLWSELGRAGRFALAGLVAAVLVTVSLGSFLPAEIRRNLVAAEGRGLVVAVEAIEAELPPLAGRSSLTPTERAAVDGLVRRSLLGGDRVRVKLWSLDGVVLYSDEPSLIGRRFVEALERIDAARTDLVYADVTELDEAEHTSETGFPRLVEYYVAVREPATRGVVAVVEAYEDVRFLAKAVGSIEFVIWTSIAAAVGLLVTFLVVLMVVTLRSLHRERSQAAAHAQDLEILVATAESLATSLDPAGLTTAVTDRVSTVLELSRFEIVAPEDAGDGELIGELSDGAWLVVERPGRPLSPTERATLRAAARLLDAVRSNAQLYADVREAARDPGGLAGQLERVRDDERRRLVRDLHDSVAGELVRALYAVRRLEAAGTQLNIDLRQGLADLHQRVESAGDLLRGFMGRTSSMPEEGARLSEVLDVLLDSMQRETGIRIERRYLGDLATVPGEVRLTSLRIVNEALLNVQQHAAADLVQISVRRIADALMLTVDDNGRGWSRERLPGRGHGLGLGYVRERVAQLGGTVRVGRSRLGGARLAIRLPLGP